MPKPVSAFLFGSLEGRGNGEQWALLLGLSAVSAAILDFVHMPAAFLLGPMGAGIYLAARNGRVRVAPWPFILSQGLIGSMMAHGITGSILGTFALHWPLFLCSIMAVITASSSLGWTLARWQVLPGTSAVWGSSPGAATAITLMSEAYGADVRLVAFMQYLRVVLVVLVASLVSSLWIAPGPHTVRVDAPWFPPIAWWSFAETLALAFLGATAGRVFRVPSGPMLVPLVLGTLLHGTGVMSIELPRWLLAVSYCLLGWSIGLRFTREILLHVARALPRVAASTLTLIAICGGFAFVLNRVAGIDPLTAYLATSPGGADSVAIIASSTKVDMPFVIGLQTARFLIVLATGPAIARFIARRLDAAASFTTP